MILDSHTSSYSAWRSGFDAALDLVVIGGKPFTLDEFVLVHDSELYWNLNTLINVGRDSTFGVWHLTGARMAIYMACLTNWDYRQAQDEQTMVDLFDTIERENPEVVCARVADDLSEQMKLLPTYMPAPASQILQHWINRSSQED